MTPLEELQAAHKRLNELRSASTAAPWGQSFDPNAYKSSGFAAGYEVFEADSPASAQLIITLHRTIDAQLSILEGDIALVECFGGNYSGDGLTLARAINGAAS